MTSLLNVALDPARRVERSLELDGEDAEGLLVTFLAELLYLMESDGLAFDRYDLEIDAMHLTARLGGAVLVSQDKEIKAVTYHNLNIQSTPAGYTVTIVFDV
jgi:SHS2 domain-containing protein